MPKENDIKNQPVADHKQLASIYKKGGSFDKQRKLLLENFKDSQTHKNLILKLRLMVENKVKNDPSILLKNRGKMGALIQGEIISNSSADSPILNIVDKDIQEKIIDSPEFHEILKVELKDIKRKCEGISDEDYAAHLKEEEKLKQEEEQRVEKERIEKELAYKNNFKVKQLAATHMAKPPRFNFSSKNIRDRDRERDGNRDRDPYGRGGYGPKGGQLMY
ncbi:CIC11C00000002485 [Sungouiella intermedia]|uniref:CIC11C00000002485 n=1 Tax=Sungouiella intermedia TaxID=45354 RepID=A0A1L0C0M0_9ASCO|nr:CIC11C00000002485 [[Candida] intermedia]